MPKSPNGGIELLLVQAVDHLGKQGDVVAVQPGYALNYLLAARPGDDATDHHKRMVAKHRAQLEQIEKTRLAGLRALAEELGRQSVTIEANANDEGHLYGSVGAVDIVNALKRNKITIAQSALLGLQAHHHVDPAHLVAVRDLRQLADDRGRVRNVDQIVLGLDEEVVVIRYVGIEIGL